jgi:hypothetical protein
MGFRDPIDSCAVRRRCHDEDLPQVVSHFDEPETRWTFCITGIRERSTFVC